MIFFFLYNPPLFPTNPLSPTPESSQDTSSLVHFGPFWSVRSHSVRFGRLLASLGGSGWVGVLFYQISRKWTSLKRPFSKRSLFLDADRTLAQLVRPDGADLNSKASVTKRRAHSTKEEIQRPPLGVYNPLSLIPLSLLFFFCDFACFSGKVIPQNPWERKQHAPKKQGKSQKKKSKEIPKKQGKGDQGCFQTYYCKLGTYCVKLLRSAVTCAI